MISRTFLVDISNDILHKVTALMKVATCCKSQVVVSTEEHQVCADSIMGLMVLFNAKQEQTITVSADGTDAEEVMKKITMIFDST